MIKYHLLLLVFFSFIAVSTSAQQTIRADKKKLVLSYYKNGRIKEKGYQGYYEDPNISTGMPVGSWSKYDINGKLTESTYYHNDVPSRAYIQKTKYYSNGKISSVERFNNYKLYESTVDSIGTWKYYDIQGRITKKISH